MAQIWPRKLPRSVRSNPLRAAECDVFDRLRDALSGEWVVFYSRPWLGLTPTGEEVDGEADFVVVHPTHGLLAIEVKGGAIAYDPASDEWTSRDRHGVNHSIKNPVEQGRKAKYNLVRILKESRHWKPRRIRARHGVIFPNTSLSPADLGADRPRMIFADRQQVNTGLAAWVLDRLHRSEDDDHRDDGAPGADGIRALESALAAPFHLQVPLAHHLDDDDRDIDLLTARQFHLLRSIEAIPRIAIRGAAGTGKTVLAAESARRAHEQGRRVLLTCYNPALAASLRQRLGSDIEVQGFHSLCGLLVKRAGLRTTPGIPERDLYENELPNLLADAATLLPDVRYDTVIVDEGQDFRPHWWPAIDALLADGGRLILFHDSNQKFYGDADALPKDVTAVPVTLNQNLRNTRRIHALVMRHYRGDPVLDSEVAGQEPDAVSVEGDSGIVGRCARVVSRLVDTERIAPEDIAVLVARDDERILVAPRGAIGDLPVRSCDSAVREGVTLDTVRRFKGLEARVVLIVATPALVADSDLAYVATSRARTHLIAVGETPSLSSLGFFTSQS